MDKAQIDLLIQQSIDDVLTTDDEARLAGILEQSSEARAELEDFRAIDRIIGRLPQETVPDGFSRRVMAALPKPVAEPRRAPTWSLSTFFGMPSLRLAYAAVAVVAVSVIGTLSLSGQLPAQTSGTAGTMVGATTIAAQLNTASLQAELSLASADGGFQWLTATLDAPGTLTIAFPDASYRVVGIDYLNSVPATTRVRPDGLSLTFAEAASARVRLEPSTRSSPPIDVLLADPTGTIAETTLDPASR